MAMYPVHGKFGLLEKIGDYFYENLPGYMESCRLDGSMDSVERFLLNATVGVGIVFIGKLVYDIHKEDGF